MWSTKREKYWECKFHILENKNSVLFRVDSLWSIWVFLFPQIHIITAVEWVQQSKTHLCFDTNQQQNDEYQNYIAPSWSLSIVQIYKQLASKHQQE